MKVLKICSNNKVRAQLSNEEWLRMVKQFNRAAKPIEHIVDLLESNIIKIDNELNDVATLYDKPRADLYTAAQLAKRSAYMELRALLTESIDVDQTEK